MDSLEETYKKIGLEKYYYLLYPKNKKKENTKSLNHNKSRR